ncbi:MAG: hypothetical protein H0T42_24320 [Deltaproteobacteria bacterium]|nr:hypothetical protein [Deltaproteobacteria bacterium]
MKGILAGLALGVTFAGVVACGGAQQTKGFDKRNEISNLWTQIRGWRHEAKMDLDPPATFISVVRSQSARDAARVCKAHVTEPATCSDICSIADAICDNAEAICGLADELGKNDSFAQEKCTSAKASCREAKQRCCGCSDDIKSPTGATGVQGSLW